MQTQPSARRGGADPLPVRSVGELVRALGGPAQLARELGLPYRSAVSNWVADDAVPLRWHARILALSLRENVLWRPDYWPPEAKLRWDARAAAAGQ